VVRLQRPLSPPGRVCAALVGLSRLTAAGLLGLVLLAGAFGPPSVRVGVPDGPSQVDVTVMPA
jgi:hypothetical protein